MPIYEYQCQKCGKTSDFLFRSGKPEQQLHCTFCGSEELTRMMSTAGIMKSEQRTPGTTCCGREERCDTPPCANGGGCCR
jgi:putative FmdB family regulatory protein